MFSSKDENQVNAMGERAKATIEALAEELKKRGHQVEMVDVEKNQYHTSIGSVTHGLIRSVDGISLFMELRGQVSGAASLARSTYYNGRLTMRIGFSGDSTTYPEPKKGYDIAKTAERILNYVVYVQRKRAESKELTAQVNSASQKASEIQELFNKTLGYGVADVKGYRIELQGRTTPYTTPLVSIRMDKDEAEAVAELLKTMRANKKA